MKKLGKKHFQVFFLGFPAYLVIGMDRTGRISVYFYTLYDI